MHTMEQVERDGLHIAFCSCGAKCTPQFRKDEAEDWAYRHLDLARRAQAHLRDRSPSIKDQHHWYAERAADPHETPENRVLWRMLADGLASRIGTPEKDDALPMDVKYTPRRRTTRDDP
jgi:hypothetical protein